MRECEKCRNRIPEGMQICPHCGLLPPKLPPQFFLYAVLTLTAVGSAVYFRPFADGKAIGLVPPGILWAAFLIFIMLAVIFLAVVLVLLSAYSKRSFKGKLTGSERIRFVKMKQHIESEHHFYEDSEYCSVCGHRKT